MAGVERLLQAFNKAVETAAQPDLIVIDVNLAVGGYKSYELIEEIRKCRGGLGQAVVMATGGAFHLISRDNLGLVNNQLNEPPSTWVGRMLTSGAESLIFNKQAGAMFLGRLGEGLSAWKLLARRRAWSHLLSKLADALDERAPDRTKVAQDLVDLLCFELGMQTAVLRRRIHDHRYELLAQAGIGNEASEHISLDPYEIGVLRKILEREGEEETSGKPLMLNEGVPENLCGNWPEGIKGRRYLGWGAFLGKQLYAFISLLRNIDLPAFDEVDIQGLKALAAMLASALGRAEAMDVLAARQTRLLKFANALAQSQTRTPVCTAMVELLHELLHDDTDLGRVTCRLVDFGTGDLVPKGRRLGYGNDGEAKTFSIFDGGIYADTVLNKTPHAGVIEVDDCHHRIDDVRIVPKFRDTAGQLTRSELCVPLLLGKHAIGAVNLEHQSLNRYSKDDARFVHAVAAVASQAIANATAHRFQRAMLAFNNGFEQPTTEELDKLLRDVLFKLTGFSVLLDVVAADVERPERAWHVEKADVRLKQLQAPVLMEQVNRIYANQWSASDDASVALEERPPWLAKLLRQPSNSVGWAKFSDDSEDFLPSELANDWKQKAGAILWLRKDPLAPPHRALLLLWSVPPPVQQQVHLMESLAQLFSSMQAQQSFVKDQIEARLIGEAHAKIGAVMQHFRHRLAGLSRGLGSDIGDMRRNLNEGNLDAAREVLETMEITSSLITQGFHRSRAYVKPIVRQPVRLIDIVRHALNDPHWIDLNRQRSVEQDVDVADSLVVIVDPVVCALALYSLLENAWQAMEHLPKAKRQILIRAHASGARIVLEISDSGAGVPRSMLGKLFQYGQTSKSQGMGSALAFARARLLDTDAKIDFLGNSPTLSGACFGLTFEASNEPAQQLDV